MSELRALWVRFTLGFWFLPGVVVLVFATLAVGAIEVEQWVRYEGAIPHTFDGDAQAARSILSSIAGGFITVAGVALSITIVTLQLVSSQYSPLALSTFLSDRSNQVVIGTLVGIVVYALLVLRVVRSGGDNAVADEFVPRVAVSLSMLAALFGLALLVYFVHHLATSIQVTAIARRVAGETLDGITTLYPEPFAEREPDAADDLLADWGHEAVPGVVTSNGPGYVENVDVDEALAGLPQDTRAHVRVRPGDFVTDCDALVYLWPAERADDARANRVRAAVGINAHRSRVQDVRLGLRQLGDIALRALSPSLNDPTTAVTCIGYMRAVLEHLADRRFPARARRLDSGAHVVVERPSFAEYLDAITEVGRHSRDEPRVLDAVLATLDAVEHRARGASAHDHAEAVVAARDDVCAALARG